MRMLRGGITRGTSGGARRSPRKCTVGGGGGAAAGAKVAISASSERGRRRQRARRRRRGPGGGAAEKLAQRRLGRRAAGRALAVAEPGDQHVVGEDVDAARDAAGGLGDGPGSARRQHLAQLAGAAGDQAVGDVVEALLRAERTEPRT